MVQNAVKAGYKRIAMVHDTSALGTGAKADMEAAFKELGVQPVTDVSYNAGDVDMLPAAQKLKESKADMCLFFTLAVDGARIVKAMEKIDYLPPKTAIHGYTCLGQPAFRELGGTAANGVLCNTPTKCAYKTGAQPSDRVLNIAKAFEAKFGADATNQVIYATALAHYDCVYILKEAIEKAGSTDADKVKAAIESISKYDGANSDYTFGPNKHDGNDIANLSATVVVKNTKGCFELAQ